MSALRGHRGLLIVLGAAFALLAGEATADCKFSHDFAGDTDDDMSSAMVISRRCRAEIFDQVSRKYGRVSVYADDRVCGVANATDEATAKEGPICYSDPGKGVKKAFMQQVRLPAELYYDDFQGVTKKRFKAKRRALEEAWSLALLNDTEVRSAWKLSRVVVLALEWAPKDRTDPYSNGVAVSLLIQFAAAESVTNEAFDAKFKVLTDGDLLNKRYKIDRTTFSEKVTAPAKCATPADALNATAPRNIWEASQGDDMGAPDIGTPVDFKCPDDLRFSDDSDDFDEYDNTISVYCTTLGYYNGPKVWPKCVPECPAKPPDAPAITGLVPVEAPAPIPSGKMGKYMCSDAALGVDRDDTIYWEVKCNASGDFLLPHEEAGWPICRSRTTTVSPLIRAAVRARLNKGKTYTERRARITQYGTEVDIPPPENYFIEILLPATLGLAILVLLCCWCTKPDSVCYRACSDTKQHPLGKKYVRM